MPKATLGSSSEGKDIVHGNYRGYYGMRDISSNERISSFSACWFRKKICIDVGCNSGELTLAIASKYQPKSIIGVVRYF
jgi:7SK snRNA methylphosphate capping enzyme